MSNTEHDVRLRREVDYDADRGLQRDQERDEGRGATDWFRGTPPERPPRGLLDRRRFVETKWSFKTTELLAFLLVGIGILVAAWYTDNLDANRAWGYVTAVTIGYLVSRGLAKAGKGTYDDA